MVPGLKSVLYGEKIIMPLSPVARHFLVARNLPPGDVDLVSEDS